MAFYPCNMGGGNKLATGTFVWNRSSTTIEFNIGFRPKYLIIQPANITAKCIQQIYNEDNNGYKGYYAGLSNSYVYNPPSSQDAYINSITDTGFILNRANTSMTGTTYCYIAMG